MKTAERAHAGALFMDEIRPGWQNEVVVKDLEMESHCNCILGQLYGDFYHGTDQLELSANRSAELGFDADRFGSALIWNKLRNAWLEEIRVRREEAA